MCTTKAEMEVEDNELWQKCIDHYTIPRPLLFPEYVIGQVEYRFPPSTQSRGFEKQFNALEHRAFTVFWIRFHIWFHSTLQVFVIFLVCKINIHLLFYSILYVSSICVLAPSILSLIIAIISPFSLMRRSIARVAKLLHMCNKKLALLPLDNKKCAEHWHSSKYIYLLSFSNSTTIFWWDNEYQSVVQLNHHYV